MTIDLLSYQGPDYIYGSFSGDKETEFAWANKKASDGIDFWTKADFSIMACKTDRVIAFDAEYHKTAFGNHKDGVDLETDNMGMTCNTLTDVHLDRDKDGTKTRCFSRVKFSTLYGTLGLNNP